MNELQIFNNPEFGSVRTITKDNEPMFCLGDLCRALDLTAKGVRQRLSDEVISTYPIEDALGRMQNALFVNEDGLYDVILESRKDSAKKFRKWVTSEVLPSIRKNGGYIAGQETLSDEELMAKALLVANNKIKERDAIIERQQAKIEADKPKTIFADAVSTSRTSILIGDLAKLICQNGVQIGQKRLFDWLRDNGYLIKCGLSRNMPMQRYVEQGLFEVKESTVQNPDGSVRITKTTKVTGKGQVYFVNKFLGGAV